MARIAIAIVVVAVWIYAIIDCARTDRSAMPGRLAKAAWLALTIFLPILGSFIWLYFSFRIKHPNGLGNTFITFPGANTARPKEKAPDDDPEFLARLDAELRFQEWERKQREHEQNKKEDPE
ncbi:PLDc_N domain-containing protein [Arcanobacterium haemolyticum]|nr:PLDc_N domain-containing protein [Arcanobacterium haemolyticum]